MATLPREVRGRLISLRLGGTAGACSPGFEEFTPSTGRGLTPQMPQGHTTAGFKILVTDSMNEKSPGKTQLVTEFRLVRNSLPATWKTSEMTFITICICPKVEITGLLTVEALGVPWTNCCGFANKNAACNTCGCKLYADSGNVGFLIFNYPITN